MDISKINNISEFATSFPDEVSDKQCLVVDNDQRTNKQFSNNILGHAKRFNSLGLNKGERIGILFFNSINKFLWGSISK